MSYYIQDFGSMETALLGSCCIASNWTFTLPYILTPTSSHCHLRLQASAVFLLHYYSHICQHHMKSEVPQSCHGHHNMHTLMESIHLCSLSTISHCHYWKKNIIHINCYLPMSVCIESVNTTFRIRWGFHLGILFHACCCKIYLIMATNDQNM